MIRIEVVNVIPDTKNGVSAKSGKPYSIREQEAWAYTYNAQGTLNPHPQKIKIILEDAQQPYPAGQYMLDASSLYVGKFDSLMIGRVKLLAKPVAAKTVQAA